MYPPLKIATIHLAAALAGFAPIAFYVTNFVDSDAIKLSLGTLPFIVAIFTAAEATYCRRQEMPPSPPNEPANP